MYTHYSLRIKAGEFEISLGFKEPFLKHFYEVFFSVENSYINYFLVFTYA